MKIKIVSICDDIRREVGNKFSLIGIYDWIVNFNVTPDKKDSWPKVMRLSLFAVIDFEEDKPHSFEIRMKYNEKEQVLGEGILSDMSGKDEGKFTIALIRNNFEFAQPGTIKFTFDFFDADKKTIASLSPDYDLKINEIVIK